MDISITLSNSPSPVKKTGNSQRAFELAGELYSCIQQWNLLISTGRAIISNILKLKTESWDNPEQKNSKETELELQCEQLGSLICEMEMLPKQMDKIRDQYVALEKLEEFHQQKVGSTSKNNSISALFLTWPTTKFVTVVTSVREAFAEELQLKKSIAENVAHCQERQMLDFHKIAWVHQVCVTPDIKLQLESLLVETGQR